VLGVQTEPNDVSSMKALWFYLLVNKCSETKYGNPYLKITMKVQLTKLKTQSDRSSQKKRRTNIFASKPHEQAD
jgi:hypothetical protein